MKRLALVVPQLSYETPSVTMVESQVTQVKSDSIFERVSKHLNNIKTDPRLQGISFQISLL